MGSEEIEKEMNSGKMICMAISKVLFSHLGLCFMVILYCVLGGFLFELLEKENEIQACIDSRQDYADMENETLFSLLDVVLSNPLGSEAADAQLVGVFETFRNNSISIDYDGRWCEGYGLPDGPMHEWNFAGGLFFSMTVITTIGYGHISPKTIWGRILCMSYAMLGIPIMLMFLTNIGDVLADIFRYVYAKIICCGCMKKKHRTEPVVVKTGTTSLEQRPFPIPGGSETRTNSKGPTQTMSREPTELSGHSESESKQIPTGATHLNIKALVSTDLKERGRRIRLSSGTEPLIVDDNSDDDLDEQDWEDISKVSVPLTISLGIIGLYIILGAILFKYWEGWDMLQASYFCFITLSTIGFGDVTPGRDFDDPMANARLIIGTVYSIFGMAILAMCFTLMQEEMTAKFTWVGQKMGVVDLADEVEDEDDNDKLVANLNSRNQSKC